MANGQILAILTDARKLIEKKENWVKYNYYLRKNGLDCYCASGAIHVAGGSFKIIDERLHTSTSTPIERFRCINASNYLLQANNLINERRTAITTLSSFNDKHTHTEVLTLFDTAIEKAQKENA